MREILGVGAPFTDVLIRTSDDFLARHVGEKGGMVHWDTAQQDEVMALLPGEYEICSGGAAGNTIFGLAGLGITSALLGMVGPDSYGEAYKQAFRAVGGEADYLFVHPEMASARCFSFVTADGERTMRSFLGASLELRAEEVRKVDFSDFKIVYIEGYQLFNREMITEVFVRAKQAGCLIALDLASFEVVRIFRDWIEELLRDYVDIVFANEDEARAFTGDGQSEEEMARTLGQFCEIAAVKIGSRGSLIVRNGVLSRIGCRKVRTVDTTGAGDAWTTGFFYGFCKGLPMEHCGELGSLIAAEVVQAMGARVPSERWDKLVREVEKITSK